MRAVHVVALRVVLDFRAFHRAGIDAVFQRHRGVERLAALGQGTSWVGSISYRSNFAMAAVMPTASRINTSAAVDETAARMRSGRTRNSAASTSKT